MRYFNCQKRKIFELFDQGFIPSQIYGKVTVKKHTLFNYYQQWKREREKLKKQREIISLTKEWEEEMRNVRLEKELQLQNPRGAKKEIRKLIQCS